MHEDLIRRLRSYASSLEVFEADGEFTEIGMTAAQVSRRRKTDLEAADALEAMQADAARYRWLQGHTVATGLSRWMGHKQFLDAAIDAARSGETT